MLQWLGDKILSIHIDLTRDSYAAILSVVFILLAIFFLYSRKLNARLEAIVPAPHGLLRLSQAISASRAAPAGRSNMFAYFAQKIKLDRVLQKADWLFHDKLRMLPDANTGQRLNFFALAFGGYLYGHIYMWYLGSDTVYSFLLSRDGQIMPSHVPQASTSFWLLFFFAILTVFAGLLPFCLVQKNREFYFDLFALFTLLETACGKIVFCWSKGCCIGIPYRWGVYDPSLETTLFPVQLFEAATGFLLSVLCILFMLYAKSYRPGYGCSFCLVAVAVQRFYWDFWRYHGEFYRQAESNGIFGLTTAQVMCIILCILAFVWLMLLPLEKKLLDRFSLFAVGRLRKLTDKITH